MLTTFDLDDYVYEALRAGASGFLLKDSPRHDLIAAVRAAAAGDALLAPSVTRRLIEAFARRPPETSPSPSRLASLTARERDVLLLLAQGPQQRRDRGGPVRQRGDRQDPRRQPAGEAGPARPGAGGDPRLRDGTGGAGLARLTAARAALRPAAAASPAPPGRGRRRGAAGRRRAGSPPAGRSGGRRAARRWSTARSRGTRPGGRSETHSATRRPPMPRPRARGSTSSSRSCAVVSVLRTQNTHPAGSPPSSAIHTASPR